MLCRVDHKQGKLIDVRYSQGQRKRLALMSVGAQEKRGCILLGGGRRWWSDHALKTFYRQLLPVASSVGWYLV